jgi:hypothetical protein
MKKPMHLIALVLICLFFTSCGGKEGPMGPAGLTLLREYTGQFAEAGNYSLDVLEITGKRTTTFVMAYWAFSEVPDAWVPMTDGIPSGFTDITEPHVLGVSWTLGKVAFYSMSAGDYYLVQVFQHD